MHPMLNIAIRAARAAGDSIVREMDRVSDISIDIKGKNDFVTEVDKQAEYIIIETQRNQVNLAIVNTSGLLTRLMAQLIFYMVSLILLSLLHFNIKIV